MTTATTSRPAGRARKPRTPPDGLTWLPSPAPDLHARHPRAVSCDTEDARCTATIDGGWDDAVDAGWRTDLAGYRRCPACLDDPYVRAVFCTVFPGREVEVWRQPETPAPAEPPGLPALPAGQEAALQRFLHDTAELT